MTFALGDVCRVYQEVTKAFNFIEMPDGTRVLNTEQFLTAFDRPGDFFKTAADGSSRRKLTTDDKHALFRYFRCYLDALKRMYPGEAEQRVLNEARERLEEEYKKTYYCRKRSRAATVVGADEHRDTPKESRDVSQEGSMGTEELCDPITERATQRDAVVKGPVSEL
jgi:hypothetical protein